MKNNKYDKIIKTAAKNMDSKSAKELENNKKIQELNPLLNSLLETVEDLLSNPKETEKLLKSPQAQMLLKKLMEDN